MSIMIAEDFCKHAVDLGMSPFCPMLFYPILYPLAGMISSERYFDCSKEWLSTSHALWVCGPLSEEVRREVRFAERCHIPVQFYDVDNIIYKNIKAGVIKQMVRTFDYLEE